MLSNTAVPTYYGQFRDAVLRGEIPVCREIAMEMNRIDDLIDSPLYYYDDQAINGYINFCEGELTLTDGSPLKLLPTFKLWAEALFSWYYFEEQSRWDHGQFITVRHKKRLVNKQYLIVPRGAAKSMYLSTIQAYMLVVHTKTTEAICTAPTMRQAEETMSPIRTAIVKSRGPVFKFMTSGSIQNTTGSLRDRVKLASTKKGIQNFITNSIIEVRPMRIDKLQGSRAFVWTIDEWLSGDTRENVFDAAEQGASKNEGWIIASASSEGTVRGGVGDSIKMELEEILKGNYYNPHVSIWYYRLDDISEVGHPELWVKAQPNIGATVSYETYKTEVEKAEKVPSSRNDILAKRFNIPMEGMSYFFTYDETIVYPSFSCDGMECAMGCDMSQGDDFCSFTFLFPLGNGAYCVKTLCYISELTYSKLPIATKALYDTFIQEGSLIVMGGTVLRMMDVYDDVDNYIESHNYAVSGVGYDPYNADAFIERWVRENGPYGVVKVPQGVRTESVPLGEIKKLAETRMLLKHDQKIMQYCMGNCIVIEDNNGNRKLYKMRYRDKIDAVAALMDAYVAHSANPENFDN